MRHYKISDDVPFRVQLSWFKLSLTAGAINAGAFLSCQRFVSHVTGFVTIAGADFVHESWREAVAALTIPGYFMFGAMVSAFLSEYEDRVRHRKIARNFAMSMALVSILMIIEVALGVTGYFGVFGEFENIQADYVQLAILCMACGIQNAAVTTATGSSIRPTHLTGTTTDLGIGLVRSLISPNGSQARRHELTVSLRRIYLILMFILGAIIGTWFCTRYNYWGFVFPAVAAWLSVLDSFWQKDVTLTAGTLEKGGTV